MPTSDKAVLGIDVGTTAVKSMLVAADGSVLADAEVEHPVSVPRPGWSEQHPDMWWDSTTAAVRKTLQSAERNDHRADIAAIGLSGQMHSSVFLDDDGEVIRPALLWNDVRTTAQCRDILHKVGLQGLHGTVGNLPLEGFTAPKLLWLRQNEPDNYARLRKLLLPKDYIRYRMSGEYASEPSDAAGTLLYDVRRRVWSRHILDALEVNADILPAVVESTEISGVVSARAAAELSIPAGIPIVGGGADNAAGAVRMRCDEPRRLAGEHRHIGRGRSARIRTACSRRHELAYILPRRAQPVVSDGRHTLGGQRAALAARHFCSGRILRRADG